MADKTVKQAKKETEELRESVRGSLQDRVFRGDPISPRAKKAFPNLKQPGTGSYAEIDANMNIGGNPLHYQTHIAQKGKVKIGKKSGKK